MKLSAAAAFTFLLSSLAIAVDTSDGKPAAVARRASAVERVEMAVRSDDGKLLMKRKKHRHSHGNTGEEEDEDEDEDEEDGDATLAISFTALFAAVGAAAFAN